MASQGPLSPAVGQGIGGDADWSDAGNITASDDADASVSLSGSDVSDRLIGSGFSFSVTGPVTGILVEIEAARDETDVSQRIFSVQVMDVHTEIGTENTTESLLTTSDTYYSRGGESDTWGLSSTTLEDTTFWNGNDFGMGLMITRTTGGSTASAFVDHIRVTLWYTDDASGVPMMQQQYRRRRA